MLRELICWCLIKKRVPDQIVRLVEEMPDIVTTIVRTECDMSTEFPVTVGLHDGRALSHFLFVAVLDVGPIT